MERADIVFVRGKSWISRLIQWVDKGEFTHVAIAIDSGRVIEAQRFVKTSITEAIYEDYEIVRIPMKEEEKSRVILGASVFIGTKYDYWQVLWHLLRIKKIPRNDDSSLICSELVSRALHTAGLVDEFDTLYQLTPNQLYDYLQYLVKNRRPE